jgi:hypothetical protein
MGVLAGEVVMSRVPRFCQLALATATLAARLAAGPIVDYTVVPNALAFSTLETEIGMVDFTITNTLDGPLTVGGYDPLILYIFGDPTDGFDIDVLGPATPYVIEANGAQVVPVRIVPDLEVDDPDDPIGGIWSLTLFPEVFLGQNPLGGVAGLPLATGTDDTMLVRVADVPEPSALMLACAALLVGAAARASRRADGGSLH